ncbi:MAG TPA: HDOD domain-containing protein [Acidimicrobiales bacterium]|nr:HDOD domain-containing protein [Acidimicrobiales bacterium]
MARIDVAAQLTNMPAQPFAAMLILRLVDDPDASPAQLARLVEMDPVLAARVMRLANSPATGVRSGVNSAARAVILLGFSAVRAIAAAAASCLLSEEVDLGPVDYWAHSVTVGAAASVAAEVLGVAQNESFSAGLLHDIGSALLHRADPARYVDISANRGTRTLGDAEREAFGVSHAEAGADALGLWHFPTSFVDAVATHHCSVSGASPLAQAVILGEALAERVEPVRRGENVLRLEDVLRDLGLSPALRPTLLSRTRSEIQGIRTFLEAR